jgi:hypothetical protein
MVGKGSPAQLWGFAKAVLCEKDIWWELPVRVQLLTKEAIKDYATASILAGTRVLSDGFACLGGVSVWP